MALVRIQVRRDTAEAWAAANPVLQAGEPGFEIDSGRFKVGDGIRNWASLPYSSGALPSSSVPTPIGTSNAGTSLEYARADHSHALPAAPTFVSVTAQTATIAGDIAVTGRLIGGSHYHSSSGISDWSSAVFTAISNSLVAGSNITLDADAGERTITVTASGAGGTSGVTSVAGRTGAVVLTTDDLSDFPSQTASGGLYLTTNGDVLSWADPFAGGGVSDVNAITGSVLLQAGANISVVPNLQTGAIVISSTVTSGTGSVTGVNALTGDITIEAVTGSGLTITENGSAIEIDAEISYLDLTNVPATFAPSAHTHATADVTGLQEFVEDAVDTLLVAGSNVVLTYDDAAGTLTIDASAISPPNVVGGEGIAVDSSDPTEHVVSIDGLLDGGVYDGTVIFDDPPAFATQPDSLTVTYGTAVFTAIVINANAPTYQWEKAENGQATFAAISDGSPYAGTNTATLTVSPVSSSDNGDRFRLRVSTVDGYELVSDAATLSTVALQIVQQPIGVEFDEADTLETDPYLAVSASGGTAPYSYQWQQLVGEVWQNYAGATSATIPSLPGSLGVGESQRDTQYRCRVTDDDGVVVYSEAALIVIRAAVPSVTSDPVSTTIIGGAASFSCDYKGKGVIPSWERRLANAQEFSAIGIPGTVTVPPGAGSNTYRSTLSLTGLTGNDAYSEYRLRLTNRQGEAVSDAASLATSAPVISAHPQDATVVENNSTSFSVTANFGGGNITYQWQEQTAGGSWSDLSGKTSATLSLGTSDTPLGRNGSAFRVKVSGGGTATTSKSAVLTVISAPAAGDNAFTLHPQNGTVEEGGGYALVAVSSYLATQTHYAFARVEYDDGKIEYHPLSTGSSWRGTATRRHVTLAHSQYRASLVLPRSAWVSVCVSLSEPDHYSVTGTTTTMQPWTGIQTDTRTCVATPDANAPRAGVLALPVTNPIAQSCQGTTVLNIPEIPFTYVESQQARVTVRERQAYIGPVPNNGFWNPPTARQFTGACDSTGTHVVACAAERIAGTGAESPFGSYAYSSDGGKTWMTRGLPFPLEVSKVLYAYGKFYIFGRMTRNLGYPIGTALQSSDNGRSFEWTGWNFGDLRWDANQLAPSLAGGRLYCAVYNQASKFDPSERPWDNRRQGECVYSGTVYTTPNATSNWATASTFSFSDFYRSGPSFIRPRYYVSYSHARWYFAGTWSTTGTAFAPQSFAARAYTYHEVELGDQTQNYTLASSGHFAMVDASGNGTSNFSPITNGEIGGGPQAGDYVYFGREVTGAGAEYFRKGAGNPGVNEKLFGHSSYWTGDQKGVWADTQIMQYVFGNGYGPNLDFTTNFSVLNDPLVDGVIFLPGKMLHLFRYRYNTGTGSGTTTGVIPSPTRR